MSLIPSEASVSQHVYLRTRFGAVHDRMTTVHAERILQLVQSLLRVIVTRIDDPAVRLHQHGRPQILVAVPPIRRARCRTAGAQDALVQAVQLRAIFHSLQVLCGARLLVVPVDAIALVFGKSLEHYPQRAQPHSLALQPRLNGRVLVVEVVHVRHQVAQHVHVRQRIDLARLA